MKEVYIGAGLLTSLGILGMVSSTLLKVPCNTRFYPARLHSGKRDPKKIRLIVIHSTESSGEAANVASYFQSSSAYGSTQLVAGNDGVYRSVSDLENPAGAPGANSDGLHIEIVGMAKWSREEWLRRAPKALDNAARAIAEWSSKYGIPLAFADATAIRNPRTKGVTTHAEVSRAFKESDHWDPGPGFPMDHVLELARTYA
jgi:hypothetical protein